MSGVTPAKQGHGRAAAARRTRSSTRTPSPSRTASHPGTRPATITRSTTGITRRNTSPSTSPGFPAPPAPPAIPADPPPPSNTPAPSPSAPITLAQARRLLWRAGFGPAPGQAEALAGQPLDSGRRGRSPARPAPPTSRARAARRRRRPARARRRLGPRPLLVAGPHGALRPAARRAHDVIWHDWFATSNDEVGAQQQMLDQNDLFRAHGARQLPRAVPGRHQRPGDAHLPQRHRTSKWEPNENYAREMMELFSLGADRGAYTEDDVREMARALTGWRGDWSRRAAATTTSASTPPATTPATRPSSARPATATGDDAVRPVRRRTRCTRRSSSRSCGGTSSPRRPTKRRSPSLQGSTSARATASAPVVEAILQHPDFYDGPRAGRRRRSSTTRGCCARSAAPIDTTDVGVAGQRRRPAAVLPAERLGLGRHALARHVDLRRRAGKSPTT